MERNKLYKLSWQEPSNKPEDLNGWLVKLSLPDKEIYGVITLIYDTGTASHKLTGKYLMNARWEDSAEEALRSFYYKGPVRSWQFLYNSEQVTPIIQIPLDEFKEKMRPPTEDELREVFRSIFNFR